MRIKKFNESNKSIITDITECFIYLIESTIYDDMSMDDAVYLDEKNSDFYITICLPNINISDGDDILTQMFEFNTMVSSTYKDIQNCIDKVKSLHNDINYRYEITNNEIHKVNKEVYIPYTECIEIIFKV